jgi:hypothetical protein
MRGVVGQKWRTSGYHWRRVLANLSERRAVPATYLVHNVLEGVGAVDGKADKEEIGFWIGKWSKTVVFLLAGGIPEG